MRKALHRWIGPNILGFIAVFIAAGGGTAFALAGANTVRSEDIVNGQVKLADLHEGLVGSGITRVTDLKLRGGKEPVTVANTIVGPHRGGGAMQANGTVDLRDAPDGSDAHVAVRVRLAGEGDTDTGPDFSATIPDGGSLSVPAAIQSDAVPPGSYHMELDVRSDNPVSAGSRVLNVAVLPNG